MSRLSPAKFVTGGSWPAFHEVHMTDWEDSNVPRRPER